MSRIGNLPVKVPSGVNVTLDGNLIRVKGPKGELSQMYQNADIAVELREGEAIVTRLNDEKPARCYHGLTRTLIANMVEGVTKGYEKRLEIQGVGYRAQATGSKIVLTVGFSHPVELTPPHGVHVNMHEKEKNEVIVSGIDKQAVGQFAAIIRSIRKPEPYKGKGIRYKGEYVRRKAGKTAKK